MYCDLYKNKKCLKKYSDYIYILRNITLYKYNRMSDYDKYFLNRISVMLNEYDYIFSKKYNLNYPKK